MGKCSVGIMGEARRGSVFLEDDTYACLLRFCADPRIPGSHGKRLHSHIRRDGWRDSSNTYLANLLLQMYSRSGTPDDAYAVFRRIRRPNVYSWNLMISAFARNEKDGLALQLYRSMLSEGAKPDKCTYLPVLSASAAIGDLKEGKKTHVLIACNGLAESDVALETALLNMYAKCGDLNNARAVFRRIHCRDRIAWNAMIAAYAQKGHLKEAFDLFHSMISEGVKPHPDICLCLLNACDDSAFLQIGRDLHQVIAVNGLEVEISVQNAVVNMYGKCGSLMEARSVFDRMHEHDVVSWSTLIAGYVRNGRSKRALDLFPKMRAEGVSPNKVTFLSLLDACGSLGCIEDGREIHRCIVGGQFEADMTLQTAVLNMYGKCGSVKEARFVFDRMSSKDAISWNAMIAVYVQNGCLDEALELCKQMGSQGSTPDKDILLCILNSCTELASLESGREIHKFIVAGGEHQLESDVTVSTGVANMYGKCGSLGESQFIFDGMDCRDAVAWNAMLAAYARNGLAIHALKLFHQQGSSKEKLTPDKVTFLCLLHACSHAGLHEEGWEQFVSMSRDYHTMPSYEHFVCMIDLLGRAGSLNEVEDMARNMPIQTDTIAFKTFLSACQIHSDVERGLWMTEPGSNVHCGP